MKALKVVGNMCAIEFGSCCFGTLMVWADAARTCPVFDGLEWCLWLWAVSGIGMVGCFVARLRIKKRLKIEQVAKGVKRGYMAREIVVEG